MKLNTTKAPLTPARPVYLPTPNEKSTAILAGWIILVLGFVVALLPGIGLSMLVVSIPVCTASGLLGIIGAAKGKPFRGVLLIIASIIAFGVFMILPWISSLLGLGLFAGQQKTAAAVSPGICDGGQLTRLTN